MTMTPTLPDIKPSEARRDEKTQVTKISFGDGYEQRAKKGINHIVRKYAVSWKAITNADADTLDAFFRARAGVEPFNWTPPDAAEAAKWTCERYRRDKTAAPITDYSANLEEYFG